jgi:Family of unknown function (DUF6353)
MLEVMKYIPKPITQTIGRQLLVGQKHSPTMLFVGGIVGMVATVVVSSRATLQLEDSLAETKSNMKKAKDLVAEGRDNYTQADYQKDLGILYSRGAVTVAKLYAPSIALGVVSVVALTGSHKILTSRNVALTAAYSVLEKGFSEYRKRVVQEYGADKDRELMYPSEIRKVGTVVDASGTELDVSGIRVAPNQYSPYAKFFDQLCSSWSKDPEYNYMFLRCKQNWLNDLLQMRGHVFLNDVYDELGIDRTSAGSVVGWIISKDGDNYIDFGIFNGNSPGARDFVNGREGAILLDFNVDGVIYDKIDVFGRRKK